MLTCYNNNFDTLWAKFFGEVTEPYDTAYIFNQVKRTNDENLILVGDWMPKAKQIRACLIKCDTMGNQLWKKSYGTGNGYFRSYSTIQTSDNGYALGAYVFYIGQDESGDPWL